MRTAKLPSLIALALIVVASVLAAGQQKTMRPPNYDESKVGKYTLPDPLVFNDGKAVRSASDWTKRRAEILRLFEDNVFGHSPVPRKAHWKVFDEDRHALGGKAVRKQVTIYFSDRDDGPSEDVLIYLPTGRHPAPLLLALNFNGNQAVVADPAVKLAEVWDEKTKQAKTASVTSRGTDKQFDVDKLIERGYGFATIYYGQIEPDFEGGWQYGVRKLFLTRPPRDSEWGAIGAWSYGLSRAMDYLEHDKDVDAKRVAVMGHSRLGKTALWTGAQDRRFAMVIANCPGEGGASLARRDYGETISSITARFGYWFAPKLADFSDRVDQLPVDMHELIALSAPRPIYVTGAVDDQWADPKGEFLACVAAGPVYRLLGAQDLGTTEMPRVNEPILHTIAYHLRDGKHDVLPFDWDQYLKFMDMHFGRR